MRIAIVSDAWRPQINGVVRTIDTVARLLRADGHDVEVFGPDSDVNRHFTTGPVAGFLVDDVDGAAAELRAAGAEILLGPVADEHGNAWVHFRAPDGNVYEFTHDPGVSRPA